MTNMPKWMVRSGFGLVALVMVGALMVGSLGSAAAQGPDGGRNGDRNRPVMKLMRELIEQTADATGMEPLGVLNAMRDGQSLNDILAAAGVDSAAFVADAKAQITTAVEEAVADGSMNEQRAARLLENLDDMLARAMDATLPGGDRERRFPREERAVLDTVAELTGLDVADILEAMADGSTLAEVAEANGVPAADLAAAVEAKLREDIEQAVADGKLPEERAAALTERLPDIIERVLNASLPDRPNRPFRDRNQDGDETISVPSTGVAG